MEEATNSGGLNYVAARAAYCALPSTTKIRSLSALRPKCRHSAPPLWKMGGECAAPLCYKFRMTRGPPRDSRGAAEQAGKAAADRPPGLACAMQGICWFRVLLFLVVIALFAIVAAINARAVDVGRGQRLAQDHCAACHSIAPHTRSEVADAPPFDAIGRKYGHDAGAIATVIAGPHPKMNFAPRPAEAADIAAYIAKLEK
jgi:cytochrome c